MSGPQVDIIGQCPAWSALAGLDDLIEQAAAAALAASGGNVPDDAELSVLLTDDAAMRALNRTWRGIDKATNVLSFPAASLPLSPHLGDIVLAFETIRAEAAREGKTMADHLAHLVVHGVLHLLGHDHETNAQADGMEALERAALARLGIADPYGAGAELTETAAQES